MTYATFWQRFAAAWIDVFVPAPIFLLFLWLMSFSRALGIAFVLFNSAVYNGYSVYCHGRYGKTLGKHVMGIRVLRTDGEPIGWREAWLRDSVGIAFGVLGCVASLVALAAIADDHYYGVGLVRRVDNLEALRPAWIRSVNTIAQVWAWSEVVVMLFNKRRRSLHDFIAGTIVTAKAKVEAAP